MSKGLLFILFFTSFCLTTAFAQSNKVKGKVYDATDFSPLPGAVVILSELSKSYVTDANGNFKIEDVPSGHYTLEIKYVGFETIKKGFDLKNNQNLNLNIALKQNSQQLQAVNVFGTIDKESESASRSSEKNANNITNVVGAEAISKSPDINSANVLQRVSGVSIQQNSGGNDAYAIIRGIEPRYNNTLINGVKITSPDDKTRYVSLDIVPSELLQKIEVSKSLTPEMEGDAIGGTINLVFKDAPDNFLINANGSLGYNSLFLDRKFKDYHKGDIQQQSVYDRIGATYKATPADFSVSNLDFYDKNASPSALFGLTVGNRFFNKKLGVLIAETYQNQFFGSNSESNPTVPNPQNNFEPYITSIANRYFSNHQQNNGTNLHLDYKFNDKNKLILNNVYLHSQFNQAFYSEDTTLIGGDAGRSLYRGKPVPGTGSVHNAYRSTNNYQNLENLKLEGQHILSKHFLFDWAGVYSLATNKSPDRAQFNTNVRISYDSVSNTLNRTPEYYDGGNRIWQSNKDQDYDGLFNLTYKSNLKQHPLELKAGGLYRHKQKENLQNEYIQFALGGANSIGSRQQFSTIYAARDSILNPNGTTGYDKNNFNAYENITAGYGEFKYSLRKLDIFGGIRVENTEQGYHYKQLVLDAVDHVKKTYIDILPSLHFKYRLNAKTNIRLSYFKSLSRPNYYEIIPYNRLGINGDTQVGNPDLLHTTADNLDLRYEFFPKPDEQFFVGAFYKNLQNPIENAFVSSGSQLVFKPTNSASNATIYGVEVVYSRQFKNVGLSGNYAYVNSKVLAPKIDPFTNVRDKLQSRPLQGQAKHELNLSVDYNNPKKNYYLQLAYQYLGKTLSEVYPNYGYDYYQQPQSIVSASADKKIGKHFTLFGKFNNLLNAPKIIELNNLLTGKDVTKSSGIIGIRYTN